MGEVRLEDLRKKFGQTVAVEGVTLTIDDGELVALLGPSGCGKTTTLRMISGLESPTSGQLFINDTEVTGIDPSNRDIAMVFQDLALYPHKTVRENMGFALSQRGFNQDDIDRNVKEAADMLEISELLDRRPGGLSGGQQQRVALGRALVRDPEVFLLDEPLSSLDAKLRDQMRTEILEIHQELDVTMVYVTHDQEIAMTLGDRIAVMNDGELMQVDTPHEVYRYPQNEFVARFIGNPDMNLFDASVAFDNDVVLDVGDFQLRLEDSHLQQWRKYDGQTVRLGIRPQDIYKPGFLPRSHHDGEVVRANVDLIEELGENNDIHLHTGNSEFIARLDPDADVVMDSSMDCIFDTTKLHLFDRTTGERLDSLVEKQPSQTA